MRMFLKMKGSGWCLYEKKIGNVKKRAVSRIYGQSFFIILQLPYHPYCSIQPPLSPFCVLCWGASLAPTTIDRYDSRATSGGVDRVPLFFFFLPPLFESPLPSSYSPLPCSGVPPTGLYIQREARLCKLGGERRQRRFPYIADELYNLPKLSFHLKQPARTQTEETLFFFFSSS